MYNKNIISSLKYFHKEKIIIFATEFYQIFIEEIISTFLPHTLSEDRGQSVIFIDFIIPVLYLHQSNHTKT